MFTPDALNFWGNALGSLGYMALPALGAGIFTHLVTLGSFRRITEAHAAHGGDIKGTGGIGGRPASGLILICAKLPLTLGLSTGLLVSAGFTFNETFIYWFPNFAFAYLLLAAVAAANLLGRQAVRISQAAALGIILGGIVILIISSVWGARVPAADAPAQQHLNPVYLLCGPALLLGFDLALYGGWRSPANRVPWAGIAAALALGGLLYLCWAWIGLHYVPREKLAQTSISHIYVARALLGHTGRIIMGTIVISSVFAAVNALVFTAGRIMVPERPGDNRDAGRGRRSRLASVLLTGLIALALAGGWAGEELLETFIRTALVFWLFHYLLVNLAAWRLDHRQAGKGNAALMRGSAMAVLTLALAGLYLLETDPKSMGLLMVVIPIVAAALYLVTAAMGKIRR